MPIFITYSESLPSQVYILNVGYNKQHNRIPNFMANKDGNCYRGSSEIGIDIRTW